MREIQDIHEPFAAYLNKIGIPFHRNRPDKRTTATEGDPDFLVCWMSHCVYIECKVPGKTLSEAQEKRVAYIRAAGNKVVVAYSLEMCIEACKDILCEKDASAAKSNIRQKCVYLAARYSRREEVCEYRKQLQALGYDVKARWLNGERQLSNDGTPIGETGESLVEGTLRSGEILSQSEVSDRASKLRTRFAMDDWEDVNAAEIVISFTEQPRSKANRGGRHVEYGIALANKARVMVVGYRENIFHWLPPVEFYETWKECLEHLKTPLRSESASTSGEEKQAETVSEVATRVSPAPQNLFIAKVCGIDYVCTGDSTPGGTFERVRRATPADIINIR